MNLYFVRLRKFPYKRSPGGESWILKRKFYKAMFPERLTNMTQAKRLQSIILKDRNSCAKKTCRAVAGPHWRLHFGNTQVLWLLLDRFWGAVCWQPTGLIVAELTLGLMSTTYRFYETCWTAFGSVFWLPTSFIEVAEPTLGWCWQPTGFMRLVGPHSGLCVGYLQVLWRLLNRLWGWCRQPTGFMRLLGPHLGSHLCFFICPYCRKFDF